MTNNQLTDTDNHPANSPLTGERIERVIKALQRSIQYQNGGDMAYVIADAIKGLEELLVSKVAESEPVTGDELDQMIWKLERDGMTPKLLSLMRELRERRKADGWIPVSERMPDGSQEVLCAKEFDGPGDWRQKVGYRLAGRWTVYGASWTQTHWMPLPAAPKEVG